MELLLNLIWLSLAVPAIWLWHDQRSRRHRYLSGVVLACTLVLLFPTISASDDLQPVGVETEDAGPCKRQVKLSETAVPHAQHSAGSAPVLPTESFRFLLSSSHVGLLPLFAVASPASVVLRAFSSRGPPVSRIA